MSRPQAGTGSLSVNHAAPHEAAELLAWFRTTYAPAPGGIVFTTVLGLDNGVDAPRPVPPEADVDELAQVLGEHAEAIEASLEARAARPGRPAGSLRCPRLGVPKGYCDRFGEVAAGGGGC